MIPTVPPAMPHQMKLFIPNSHSASVPKINEPKAQPSIMQRMRTPMICELLMVAVLSLRSSAVVSRRTLLLALAQGQDLTG